MGVRTMVPSGGMVEVVMAVLVLVSLLVVVMAVLMAVMMLLLVVMLVVVLVRMVFVVGDVVRTAVSVVQILKCFKLTGKYRLPSGPSGVFLYCPGCWSPGESQVGITGCHTPAPAEHPPGPLKPACRAYWLFTTLMPPGQSDGDGDNSRIHSLALIIPSRPGLPLSRTGASSSAHQPQLL